jgi:hypothetical protein
MKNRILDLVAFLLGGFVGMILPPAVQEAASFLVVLALLAVLAYLCGRALVLFVRALARPARRLHALAPARPRALLATPTRRRLLAWLALRRRHLHTGSPSPGRRRHEQDAPPPLATPPP